MYPDERMDELVKLARNAMPSTETQPAALLGWMETLADPTRLRLLRMLERHELGVVELCAAPAIDGEPTFEGAQRSGLDAQQAAGNDQFISDPVQ